jgi:hypothetical protein
VPRRSWLGWSVLFPMNFLTSCNTVGIPPNVSEDASLRINLQRIINRYLANHFGKRIWVPENELSSFTSRFVPFKTKRVNIPDEDRPGKDKLVFYSYKDLSKIVEFYQENIFADCPQDIQKIDICLGGDRVSLHVSCCMQILFQRVFDLYPLKNFD